MGNPLESHLQVQESLLDHKSASQSSTEKVSIGNGIRWKIIQKGYNPHRQPLMEVINNLGNSYLRFRDFIGGSISEVDRGSQNDKEEKTKKTDHYHSAYVTGFYEQPLQAKPEGEEASTIPEAVNIPDFLSVKIRRNGELLDLDEAHATGTIDEYQTELDMQHAALTRRFVWVDKSGKCTSICEERIASVTDPHLYASRYTITSLDDSEKLQISTGIDGNVTNKDKDFFEGGVETESLNNGIFLKAKTKYSGQEIAIAQKTKICRSNDGNSVPDALVEEKDRAIEEGYTIAAEKGKSIVIEKMVYVYSSSDRSVMPDAVFDPVQVARDRLDEEKSFEVVLAEHNNQWERIWEKMDVEINGDDMMQQAIRFNKLQMYMSLREDMYNGIGAKAAQKVGGGYHGHDFWDTPINMLPAFDAYPMLAENYLRYQYALLDAAREKARRNNCEGAWYGWEGTVPPPYATADGEATPKYVVNPVGEIVPVFSWKGEIHRSFDTAYAVMRNYKITGNTDFMKSYGAEMVIEAAKFYASRADLPIGWKEGDPIDRYEYRDVEGPNEYHEHINNNGFTNITAKWTIMKAFELIDQGLVSEELQQRLGLTDEKLASMRDVCEKVYIPFDPYSLLIDQFDGYEDLQYVNPEPYIKRKELTGQQIDEAFLLDWKDAESRLLQVIEGMQNTKKRRQRSREIHKENLQNSLTQLSGTMHDSILKYRQRVTEMKVEKAKRFQQTERERKRQYSKRRRQWAIETGRRPDMAPFATLPEKVAKTRIGKQPDRTLALDLLGSDFLSVLTYGQKVILKNLRLPDKEIMRRITYANVFADRAGRFPGSSLGPAFWAEEDIRIGNDPTDAYGALINAARIDLDGHHKAEDGIHTAGSGKAPDAARRYAGIDYGIGVEGIDITSRLPSQWNGYTETITYDGARVNVRISREDNRIQVVLLDQTKNGTIPVTINNMRVYLHNKHDALERPYTQNEYSKQRYPVVVYAA